MDSAQTTGSVVVGEVSRRPSWIMVVTVVIAGVVISGAVFAGVVSLRSAKSRAPVSAAAVHEPSRQLADALSRVSRATSSSEKAAAYSDAATAYLATKQISQAIATYKTALSTAQSGGAPTTEAAIATQGQILQGLAAAYAQSGNITEEIIALQQEVQLMEQSTDPAVRSYIPRTQALITGLQAPKP